MISTETEDLLQHAARIATEFLQGNDDRSLPVLRYSSPAELAERFSFTLPEKGRPLESLLSDAQSILDHSVRTGHPRFLNQLFGGYDEAGILGEWICAVLNTSMYTFEVAPVGTLMELKLIEKLNAMVGFDQGEGVFTPGGSISNLMGILAARSSAFPHVKQEGLRPGDRPVLFVSEDSHYSIRRAAVVGGFGLDGAIEVPTDEVGRMVPAELVRAVERARADGRRPFLVAATAGTTVSGAFDPLEEIADIAAREDLWMHVDASYGGGVLFSEKHRHLLEGVERADSVSWNPHKMMGVPLSCAVILVREEGALRATNEMKADYLFHGDEPSPWDLGDLSLQCGRRVDVLKLWLSWQANGDEGYRERVDRLFDLAQGFAATVREREGFRLIREPQSTNVCFRYQPRVARGGSEADRLRIEDAATLKIREQLVRGGRFLVNFAPLDGAATFRVVVGNPKTTPADLVALLDEIEKLGEE